MKRKFRCNDVHFVSSLCFQWAWKFLPHPPTQAMVTFTDSSRALLWAIFTLVSSIAASYFHIHGLLLELADIVLPLLLVCGLIGGLLFFCWCIFHFFSFMQKRVRS